jgi:TIR domain
VKTKKSSVFLIRSHEGSSEIHNLIFTAAVKAGTTLIDANDVSGSITQMAIARAIKSASLVIADVTHIHPNVMFEIGLAQDKPLLLVSKGSRSTPFDISLYRFIFCDVNNPQEFVTRLSESILQALEMPEAFTIERVSEERKNLKSAFISYCHSDREYLDRLLIHLKPLEREGLIDLWVDTRLRAGDKWRLEIEKSLNRASVAILLVSADFLASDFIINKELPTVLRRAEDNGTRIIPLIVKPCRFTRDENLKHFQAVNDPKSALISLSIGQQEMYYDLVASEVERWLK